MELHGARACVEIEEKGGVATPSAPSHANRKQVNDEISPTPPEARIALSASFTAEPIQAPLEFWSRQLQRPWAVRFAPFNQLYQTLHDPASEFARNRHGLNVMLVRLEDLGQFSRLDGEALAQMESNFDRLLDEAAQADGRFAAPLLFVLCPPSPLQMDVPGWTELNERAGSRMREALGGKRGVQARHWRELAEQYPVEGWHHPEGEQLGRIPYTDLYFALLATVVARELDARTRAPFKVIAVDCDNTLWAGICGEDGPEGVQMTEPHRQLQEFLLTQRALGMVLTIASKNNEQDVLDTFAAHPEFPLRPEHFAAWRINWEPKAGNLASLAEELSLGLDSFIFIDDNFKECAEVEEASPEVLSLALPFPLENLPAWLSHVWAFDHAVVTEEDRKRSANYEKVRAFKRAATGASSLEEFMASLGLTLHVAEMAPEQLPRCAQLTQRTNQFNTTTIRRTETEIAALVANSHQVWAATVADRFGEYGLTGLLILEPRAQELFVDSLLLSCRVLGRGVEHRMLAFAGQTAFDLGLETVAVPVTESARNLPARQFLESLPDAAVSQEGPSRVYRFNAVGLGQLKWRAAENQQTVAAPKTPMNGAGTRAFRKYGEIARSLAKPEQVLEAVRRESLSLYVHADVPGAPATETEQKLARLWAELLKRPSIKVTDNFFDLGGHSLLAVLLLMRIKEEFSVELSVDDVYSGTLTLGELARTLEARQLGDISAEEYESLLKEIEGLSDEEVQALLAQEEDNAGAESHN